MLPLLASFCVDYMQVLTLLRIGETTRSILAFSTPFPFPWIRPWSASQAQAAVADTVIDVITAPVIPLPRGASFRAQKIALSPAGA